MAKIFALVAACIIACAYAAPMAQSGNMNGKYKVGSGARMGNIWNDDYASKGHEYFDVWAPEIATHYGEVFWTSQGNQPLPKAIVDRFKGKVMAITGYEQDQVMVVPTGHPGANPEQDVSVPINWAYSESLNHPQCHNKHRERERVVEMREERGKGYLLERMSCYLHSATGRF